MMKCVVMYFIRKKASVFGCIEIHATCFDEVIGKYAHAMGTNP